MRIRQWVIAILIMAAQASAGTVVAEPETLKLEHVGPLALWNWSLMYEGEEALWSYDRIDGITQFWVPVEPQSWGAIKAMYR